MCFEELEKAAPMVNLKRPVTYSLQGLKERYLILPGNLVTSCPFYLLFATVFRDRLKIGPAKHYIELPFELI